MKLKGIVWMGVQTERFAEMSTLMRTLTGTPPGMEDDGFNLWATPDGDLIELFAPGRQPAFGAGPVVGFLVDDLESSRRDLEAAGGVVVGGYGPNEDGYQSVQFRAPDGNVYEIIVDPGREERAARERGAGAP